MGDPRSGDPSQGIVTNHDWTRGLFQVHKDSCLTLTYKLERPGWVQVFLGTRQADLASASGANVYLLEPWEAAAGERWWDIPAGTWYTARIPLAGFFKVSDRNSGITPGDVGFGLTFSSQEHDRGLVIDRISIEPTGPQSVEIEALKQ